MVKHPFDSNFFNPLIEKAIELIQPSRIVLFGSFARGDFHEKSDIDLAFDFIGNEDNWLKFKFWARENFGTLRRLDLLNFQQADRDLQNAVMREGKVLYENKN